MGIRGVKMANQLISGQAENGRSFNVKVGEGGEGRQVTPPLDKIDRYYHFQAPSLLGKYTTSKQYIYVQCIVDSLYNKNT